MVESKPNEIAEAALAWAEIDLGAIRENYRTICDAVTDLVTTMPVIKADAYGHGAVEVARTLTKAGAETLCVVRVEEAIELCENGIEAAILVLSAQGPLQAELVVRYNFETVVSTEDQIAQLASYASASRPVRVHLKVDVGMRRVGCYPEEVLPLAAAIRNDPRLNFHGFMTHLPCADSPDTMLTESMIEQFQWQVDQLAQANLLPPVIHASNSAAILQHPSARFNMVRPGILLYGQYPAAQMWQTLALRPAMSVHAKVVQVRDIAVGAGVSYGHSYHAKQPTKIAVVAIGYGDGYPRHASNIASMLVHGKSARVVGRVCMDYTMLDVTDIDGVKPGSEATAFGHQNGVLHPAESVAEAFGSIGYELTTRISKRVPRVYINE